MVFDFKIQNILFVVHDCSAGAGVVYWGVNFDEIWEGAFRFAFFEEFDVSFYELLFGFQFPESI
jgi:hypothetical protein